MSIARPVTARRAQEQGQDAVVRLRFGRRPPLRAGEELRQVQLAAKHRQGLAKDEKEDAEDQQDRAPAAEPDQPFDGRFRAVQHDLQHGIAAARGRASSHAGLSSALIIHSCRRARIPAP